MSLAALPAYFLARRVLPVGLSLFAAVLAVALPSLLYAGEVMTENAFYPIFLAVVLVFVLTLERPTPARQLLLLGCCVVAYLTRAQALAFFPAIAVAPVLLGTWRSFRVLYGTLGGAALVALVAQLVRGESPLGLLGAYSVAGDYAYEPAEVLRWLVYHVAELDLYVGRRSRSRRCSCCFALWNRLPRSLRPFLAATASLSAFLLLEVSAFASLPSVQRIEERNLFYLAPLMLIALLVWVDQGAPRPPLTAGAAAVLAAALPAVIPYERLIGVPSQSDTLLMLALWRVHERWVELDEVVAVVVACSIVAALAFLLVPRRFAIVLPLVVLAFFLAIARPISARMEYAAAGALAEGMHKQDREWVDKAVAGRGDVGVLWTGNGSRFSVWQNEFFNRSVGPVFYAGTPMEGGLPATKVTLDRSTGVLHGAPDVPFVLTDGSAELVGDVVAKDGARNVFLYQVDRSAAAGGARRGAAPRGHVVRPERDLHALRLHGRNGRRRAAERRRALPGAFDACGCWERRSRRRFRRTARPHVLVAPLTPVDGRCVARFAVSPTKVPGPNDPRPLGLHFNSFTLPHPEDRRRRLAALAPAHRDRQLHPRNADRPGRGRRGRRRRVRAGERARGADDRRVAGRDPDRAPPPHAAGVVRVARGVVGGEATAPRAHPRRLRRLPPLRLAARPAARRSARDDDLRPRAAPLSGVVAPAHAQAPRAQLPRGEARGRPVRDLGVHRERRRAAARRAAARRVSGRRRAVHAGRAARGRRRRARDRHARAAQEPRGARRARRAGRRLRPRRRAAAALPGCVRVRLSVALRGLRDAGRRGDGERDARRLLEPRLARRGGGRRRRARRRRGSDGRSRRGSRRRASGARSSSREVSSTRAGSRGARPASRCFAATARRPREGRARRLAAPADPRRLRALRRGAAAGAAEARRAPGARVGRHGPRDGRDPRCRLVSARAAAGRARRRRAPLPDVSRAAAQLRADGRHRPRSRRAAAPGALQPVEPHVQPAHRPARRAGGAPRDRDLGVHEARARRAARRRPRPR